MDNEKLQAERTEYKKMHAAECGTDPYPLKQEQRCYSSLKDDLGRAAEFHATALNQAREAFEFLSAHPEFDAFVRLVRSGAIRF